MTIRTHIKLAPDWRIVSAGLGYELHFKDPVRLEWHTMYEAPLIRYCEQAYLVFQDGEQPRAWDQIDEIVT